MSEIMATEAIIEAEWILKGYWTKPRYAYQTENSGWSDIDVLSYNPETKHLVISESKVRGPKRDVYAWTEDTEKLKGEKFHEWEGENYLSFIWNLPKIVEDSNIFSDFNKQVKKLTIQFVSNYVISDKIEDKVIKEILGVINKEVSVKAKIEFKIDTTLDVFSRIIELEQNSSQGRRYGNPILDLAREINRYKHPSVKQAGRTKSAREEINKKGFDSFLKALGVKIA